MGAPAVVMVVRRSGDDASRVEVADATGLSEAIVSKRVRSLVDAGLFEEAGDSTARVDLVPSG